MAFIASQPFFDFIHKLYYWQRFVFGFSIKSAFSMKWWCCIVVRQKSIPVWGWCISILEFSPDWRPTWKKYRAMFSLMICRPCHIQKQRQIWAKQEKWLTNLKSSLDKYMPSTLDLFWLTWQGSRRHSSDLVGWRHRAVDLLLTYDCLEELNFLVQPLGQSHWCSKLSKIYTLTNSQGLLQNNHWSIP